VRDHRDDDARPVSHEWTTVALEEYKTLRQESLAAIEQMQRTLQIGLVAISVLTAFGVEAVNEGPGVQVGLALATPVLAALVVALSLDELHRTVAAGAHAAVLEQRIARRVDEKDPPLTWESQVQENFDPRKDRIRHWVTLIVLLAAAAPAVFLGIFEYREEHSPEWVCVLLGVLLVGALIAWYQRHTLKAVTDLHDSALVRMDEIQAAPISTGATS
jgi:hypothetical protein